MAGKRLTVLQMLPALESGGVERGTLEVANELVRQGHRSLVMSAGGRLVAELVERGSEHVAWPVGRKSLWTLRLVKPFRRFLRDQQVDILHLRSRMPAWLGYLAWRGMPKASRPRLVTTVHGFYSVNFYSAVMTRGERVICVSNPVRDYVVNNYPKVDKGKLQVIHRGVDPQMYPYGYLPGAHWVAEWYRQYPMLQEDYVITLPGRITRLKGHEDFIDIIAELVSRGCAVRGLIVGGAHPRKQAYARELERKIEDNDLLGRVIMTGHRSDLREVLAMSDVVLSLSSVPESFGRTTLEALSIGKPVCAYAHGGVSEQLAAILPEGAVPVGDKDAVVERLAQWYQQPPRVPERHDFTLQQMLEQTLAVYQQPIPSPR